jgi:long-chain acyl-CoA synthetase
MELGRLTLADVVRQHARLLPGKPAAVCVRHRATYPELADRVDRLVTVLRDAGVGRGDRVLWHGYNCHRVLESLLASARLGAIFCPLNWRGSADEITRVVEDAAPRVLLRQEGDVVWIRHGTDQVDGYEERLVAATPDTNRRDGEGDLPVLMLHTAAFDGRPHGALLREAGLLQQAAIMGMLEETSPAYTYLNSGPLFHIATMVMTLATLVAGGTNVFVPKVDAAEMCGVIARERCNGAYILQPTAEEIASLNEDRRFDLSSLRVRTGVPAFDVMCAEETTWWSARPGGYGQTEAGGLLTYRALGPPPVGSHGWPSPLAHLRIVDPDGRDVAPGEVGEIVARSPTVMVGYWNRPDLSAERQRDGWHHTHDLGRIEADGSLTFVAPMSRIVKSASENIYPAEVEACLATHAGVAEVAVIGTPDPVWTQSVKAIVVRAAGHDVTEEELIEHCRSRIASYKKPRFVVFVDALPRRGGQVDYDRLDAEHGGGGYPGIA